MQKESSLTEIRSSPSYSPIAEEKSTKRVSVRTLGCRLNFFETDGILSVLKKSGYEVTDFDNNPSHIIVNTCTVTNRADVKNRNIIRQAIKKNPGAKVWVTGCYAETDKSAIEKIPGVFGVLGNREKSSLAYRILEEDKANKRDFSTEMANKNYPNNLDRFSYSDVLPDGHTRAYLKIQDGCNRKCSYCKIPRARGEGVSRDYKDVLDQVRFLQDNGVAEIILTGVNLGWFRNENREKSFIPLLEDILDILDYSRLRLSSIEPPDVGNELAELFRHPRFCKFLHIPLQSGSAKILRDMRRTYNPLSFRNRVERVKEKNPGIFLGTDVITGFPGETEVEFQESWDLLSDLEFSRIHAFPYSVRSQTTAESLGDSIPKEIKKARVAKLNELSQLHTTRYIESYKGKIAEAILEKDGILITDNYIKGTLEKESLTSLFPGQFLDVEIVGIQKDEKDNPLAIFKIRS